MTGLKNTDKNALDMCSPRNAIPAQDLASHYHGANGLFGSPVGGFQARTDQEGKQSLWLPQQMMGETLIRHRAIATFQTAVQLRFQFSAGYRCLQSVLRDRFNPARKFRVAFSATKIISRQRRSR
jgi:hypothetical protein